MWEVITTEVKCTTVSSDYAKVSTDLVTGYTFSYTFTSSISVGHHYPVSSEYDYIIL